MNNTIKVRVVSQYGNKRVFPVCAKAALFCDIADQGTLTDRTIKAIKALGYAVVVVADQPPTL